AVVSESCARGSMMNASCSSAQRLSPNTQLMRLVRLPAPQLLYTLKKPRPPTKSLICVRERSRHLLKTWLSFKVRELLIFVLTLPQKLVAVARQLVGSTLSIAAASLHSTTFSVQLSSWVEARLVNDRTALSNTFS